MVTGDFSEGGSKQKAKICQGQEVQGSTENPGECPVMPLTLEYGLSSH